MLVSPLSAGLSILLLGVSSAAQPSNVHIDRKVFSGDASDNKAVEAPAPIQLKKRRRERFVFRQDFVEFDASFAGGRATRVKRVGPGKYELFSEMENYPINDSPWYAFRLRSTTSTAQAVEIRFTYPNGEGGYKGTHRYWPKVSGDKRNWKRAESFDEKTATLKIEAGTDPLWIAAQELETSEDIEFWITNIVDIYPYAKRYRAGKLKSGKEIPVLRINENPKVRKQVILVLGRHHPPEVTGSIASRAFLEAFLSGKKPFSDLRKKYEIVMLPLLNPDGVDQGHWRHNGGGADLNRDWGLFRHEETRLASKYILGLKRKVAFFIDFHSTHKDVIYLPEEKFSKGKKDLALQWLFRHAERLPETRFDVKRLAHFKYKHTGFYWALDTLGAPSLVYEVGDETDRVYLQKTAHSAAESLAEVLLKP